MTSAAMVISPMGVLWVRSLSMRTLRIALIICGSPAAAMALAKSSLPSASDSVVASGAASPAGTGMAMSMVLTVPNSLSGLSKSACLPTTRIWTWSGRRYFCAAAWMSAWVTVSIFLKICSE